MDEATLLSLADEYLVRFHAVNVKPPIMVEGKGCVVKDATGKEFLDFVSGQMCATLGHNHPDIVRAIESACAKMIHSSGWLHQEDSILLAKELAALLPPSLRKLIFKSTGSESNEIALHMAKMYTGRHEVVGLTGSFHGMTGQARASTYSFGHKGHGANMRGTYAIPAPYCYRCPLKMTHPQCDFACLRLGFSLVDAQSDGSLAAFIAEPILSAGGTVEPPPGYFPLVKQMCRERGMLFILDEAQTAFGRLGSMFAFEQDGVVPDVLAMSKTIGAGVPLSATATSAEIEEDIFKKHFTHGSSHVNDPLPAMVGRAVLQVIQRDGLVEAGARKGAYIKEQLHKMAERHEMIGDIRGRGMLIGIEFVRDRDTKEPAEEEGGQFTQACMKRGLIVNIIRLPGFNATCRLAPPLIASQAEIDRALEIMDDSLAEVSTGRKATAGVHAVHGRAG